MKYVLIALALVAVGLWAYNYGCMSPATQNDYHDYRAVKAVCDYSHHINSQEWEQACAKALDATDTEYVCSWGGSICRVTGPTVHHPLNVSEVERILNQPVTPIADNYNEGSN